MHMTASILDVSTLGYISGILGGLIALALVIPLTIVHSLLRRVGGADDSHVAEIEGNLTAVAVSTDVVPATLTTINTELADLAEALSAVERHINVARRLFDSVAQSR